MDRAMDRFVHTVITLRAWRWLIVAFVVGVLAAQGYCMIPARWSHANREADCLMIPGPPSSILHQALNGGVCGAGGQIKQYGWPYVDSYSLYVKAQSPSLVNDGYAAGAGRLTYRTRWIENRVIGGLLGLLAAALHLIKTALLSRIRREPDANGQQPLSDLG